MTSAAEHPTAVRADLRTILVGGGKLGLVTAIGVTAFALLSRVMSGYVETAVQTLLVLVGGTVCAFAPAVWVRPREIDSIAWATLVGLLGALVFTVLDTVILRPVNLYHWTWDQIGGGSGFWYIPVWWMGSAVLAWLGSWSYSAMVGDGGVSITQPVGVTVAVAVVAYVVLGVMGAGFTAASMGLSFGVALVVNLILTRVLRQR